MKIEIEHLDERAPREVDQGEISLVIRTAGEELHIVPPRSGNGEEDGDGRWELPGLLRRLAYALEEDELEALPRSGSLSPGGPSALEPEVLEELCHELRTPINAVVGYVELLKDQVYGELAPSQVEAVNRIRAAAEKLVVALRLLSHHADLDLGELQVTASTGAWERPLTLRRAASRNDEEDSGG